MGKKNKLNQDKFTLYVKLSRRIPNTIDISKFDERKFRPIIFEYFITDQAVREIYSDVANVRKPRQKSARFFLVDFETQDKADAFKKILEEKKMVAGIHVKVNKLSIKESNPLSKPENERQQYVNSLTKQTFQSKSLDKYSSKVNSAFLEQSDRFL